MKNMKKIIKTLFLLIISTMLYKAQVTDTLSYIKLFEINKINYQGQPLSKLMNDMTQLQPKLIWSGPGSNNTYRSTFNFCEIDDVPYSGMVNMVIFWQTPIPYPNVEYYEKKNYFHFTNDERNFYGNKIVKNIYVYTTK